MCSNDAVFHHRRKEKELRQSGGMDFDSMAIFYLIPILEIVEKTPSRGPPPNNLAGLKMGTTFLSIDLPMFY